MDAPRPSRFVETGARRRLHVSFEFFPPKTAEMEQSLWESIRRLAPLKPNFQAAGMPTNSDRKVASAKAVNTEAGDSMALKAIPGPKHALQKMDPTATAGNKWAISE